MRNKRIPKPRREISYAEAHNKAVNHYRKSSMFLFWAGILSLGAALIGVIQMVSGQLFVLNEVSYNWPKSGFSLSLSALIALDRLLIDSIQNPVISDILILLSSIIVGAGLAALGFFASKGKRLFLFLGFSLYLLDFAALFFVYYFYLAPIYSWTNYLFSIATHVIVLGALVYALICFYRVIDIEKKYHGNNNSDLEDKEDSEVIAHG